MKLVVKNIAFDMNGLVNQITLETSFINDILKYKHFKHYNIVYEIVNVIARPLDNDCVSRIKSNEVYSMILFCEKSRFGILYKHRLIPITNNMFCVSQKAISRVFK